MRSHFIKIKEKRKKKPLRSFEFVNSFTLQMSRSPNCLLTVVVLKPIKERAFEFYSMIWLVCDLKLYNCLRNAHFSSTNFLMISAGLPKKKFFLRSIWYRWFRKSKTQLELYVQLEYICIRVLFFLQLIYGHFVFRLDRGNSFFFNMQIINCMCSKRVSMVWRWLKQKLNTKRVLTFIFS